MNEGIHLDLDTWIVPGQIRKIAVLMYIYSFRYILSGISESNTSGRPNMYMLYTDMAALAADPQLCSTIVAAGVRVREGGGGQDRQPWVAVETSAHPASRAWPLDLLLLTCQVPLAS